MGRLDDVLTAIQAATQAALNNSNVLGSTFVDANGSTQQIEGGQVIVGWPTGTELTKLLGQGAGRWQISVYPLDTAKRSSDRRPKLRKTQAPTVPITATRNADGSYAISGTPSGTFTVVMIINNHTIVYEYPSGNRFFDLQLFGVVTPKFALTLAKAINDAAIPNISATANGNTLSVAGAFKFEVNVVGVGTMSREVGRITMDVQVSIWASDPFTRSAIEEPILETVGVTTAPFLQLQDGSAIWVRYNGQSWNDDSQSSYSLLVAHHRFECQYGIMQTLPGYQIGAVESVTVVNNSAPVTAVYGGPNG